MLLTFALATLPVFLIAAIGFFISRHSDLMSHPGLGQLTLHLALPALILHSMLKMDVSPGRMLHLVAATAACVLIGALVVWLLCKLCNVKPGFYVTTLVNPNTGNFGIPVIFALLGEEALAAAVIISATITLSHVTLGITAMSGTASLKGLATNTPLLALILGALINGLELPTPEVLLRTIEMLAGIAQPIMLLLLGHSLAQLKLSAGRELGVLGGMSLFRPVSGALIALGVIQFVGLDPMSSLILVMQMAMPVAVMSYLLTLRYAGPASRIAALTFTSIPVSLAVLALIFTYQSEIRALAG